MTVILSMLTLTNLLLFAAILISFGVLIAWVIYCTNFFEASIEYDIVLASMSDGMLILDKNHCLLEFNPAMEGLIGVSIRDSIGQPLTELFDTSLILTEHKATLTADVILNNGEQRYLQLQISPIFNRQQNLKGHVVIAHDVTERKQSEENARKMFRQIERIKQEWEITADSLDQLICLLDEDGAIVRINMAVENWGLEIVQDAKGQKLTTLLRRQYADLADAIDEHWSDITVELNKGWGYEMDVADTIFGHQFDVRFEPHPYPE